MRRVLPASLVLLALVPQACQRDEATAPQPFRPSARVTNPATSKIAFSSDRDGNFEIYVMSPDGSDAPASSSRGFPHSRISPCVPSSRFRSL